MAKTNNILGILRGSNKNLSKIESMLKNLNKRNAKKVSKKFAETLEEYLSKISPENLSPNYSGPHKEEVEKYENRFGDIFKEYLCILVGYME